VFLDKLTTILGRDAVIEPLPLTLRYAPGTLRAEAIKAALGAALCVAALLVLSPAPLIAWPIAAVGLLFVAYLAQQWRRSRLRLELDSAGLTRTAGVASKRLDWNTLRAFKLQFYPNRRRSLQGMLVMTLRGGFRVKLDSALEHFPTLLRHAAAAARERSLTLDPTTAANLSELGL
jgi:hypothetical protein